MGNPIIENIMNKAVRPLLQKQARTLEGVIVSVDYGKRTATIAFFDPVGNVRRIRRDVDFPKDGDGVFHQSLKNGDRVELSFRNQTYERPYISAVHRKGQTAQELDASAGRQLPGSMRLF